MKRHEKDAGKILDQFFDHLPKPSSQQIEVSRSRILDRVHWEVAEVAEVADESTDESMDAMLQAERIRPLRKRRPYFLAAAAAIVIAILIPATIFRNVALQGDRRAVVEIGDGSLVSGGQARPFKPGQP